MNISYDKITPISQKLLEKTDRPADSSLNTDKARDVLDVKPELFPTSIAKYINTRL